MLLQRKLKTTLAASLTINCLMSWSPFNLVHAKSLDLSFLTLDIPDAWDCKQQKTVWTCMPSPARPSPLALMVFGKVAGPDLTLEKELDRLKRAKVIRDPQGDRLQSSPHSAQIVQIGQNRWVQALHSNSEAPDYYTYYQTTIHNNISILLSISVHSGAYNSYKNDISKILYSVKPDPNAAVNLTETPQRQRLSPGAQIAPATSQKQTLVQKFLDKKNRVRNFSIAGGLIALLLLALAYSPKKKSSRSRRRK